MNRKTYLINRITTLLDEPGFDRSTAEALAHDIFELSHSHRDQDKVLSDDFSEQLRSKVIATGFNDLVSQHIGYAINLADAEGDLIFEEMFKLFSLCEEVNCMVELGFENDADRYVEFVNAVKGRMKKNKSVASYAAQCRIKKSNGDDWKKNFWWYAPFA